MRRFISIALVLLMVVLASISPVWANEPQEDLVQSSQEIKFRGIAIEYHEATMPGSPWYWVVEVEEVIFGPLISGKTKVITEQALPPSVPQGYVDPNINEGDRVEVFGLHAPTGDPNWVTIYGSADYYIAKASPLYLVYLPIILKDYSPAVTPTPTLTPSTPKGSRFGFVGMQVASDELVVHHSKNDRCHSEPKRSGGEESRSSIEHRDSSAFGLRMTCHQNHCGGVLVGMGFGCD